MANIDALYDAITQAEHQGFLGTEGYDPWIRTKHQPKGGSTAFGPVQMTGGKGSMMANVAGGYTDVGASPEELDWIKQRFLPQAQNFIDYGGEDMEEGMEHYDYGGRGDFGAQDKIMYEKVAKKIMEHEFMRTGGDRNIDKFIEAWRGKPSKDDSEYFDLIKEEMMLDNVTSEQGSEAF